METNKTNSSTDTSTKVDEYQQQALDFMKRNNVSLKVEFLDYKKHFSNDDQKRNVWKCKLQCGRRSYTFEFGDSINNTRKGINKPSEYSILACLNVDYSEDFEDFCNNYGYDRWDDWTGKRNKDSYRIYKAVRKESEALQRLFTEEQLEELHEIC